MNPIYLSLAVSSTSGGGERTEVNASHAEVSLLAHYLDPDQSEWGHLLRGASKDTSGSQHLLNGMFEGWSTKEVTTS